jgi:peptidoglycan/LPS O-acetylase OafA/YrhL
LDGLRAFAILPVILHHCYPRSGWFGWIAFFGQAGWMGVDLFFVLSGYLITGILLDTVDKQHYYTKFVLRRTLRIFPLYYVCLALITAATWLSGGTSWTDMRSWGPGWFVVYLGNIRGAWLNTFPPVFSFSPLWSLQVEEQFYLLYPVVVLLLSRQNLRRFLLGCVVAAPLIRLFLVLFVANSALARFELMPCRMDALAIGALVAVLTRSPSAQLPSFAQVRFGLIPTGAGVLGVYAFAWHAGHEGTVLNPLMSSLGYSLNAIEFGLLLATIVLWPSASGVAILRWRPLVYTGEIAYGLYLLTWPASWAARRLAMLVFGMDIPPGTTAISVPLTFIAGFLAASASWRFFESPILALRNRLYAESPAPGLQ